RWAIDQCMKRDVSVPTVLAIKHFSEGTDPIDICIQDKLAGDLLSIAAASLPRDRLRGICAHVGELLARVHGIRRKGNGYLNRQGEGQFQFMPISDTLVGSLQRPSPTKVYNLISPRFPEEVRYGNYTGCERFRYSLFFYNA